MIPFDNRFHGHSSLSFVYKNGKAVRSSWFIIKSIKNPRRDKTRVAVIISKKVLKGAVKRNRVRRQIYEYVNKLIPKIDTPQDIAIIVLSGELFTAPQKEIFTELNQMFSKIFNIQEIN